MKLQLIALSFVVIGCFQLLDVDGQKKTSTVGFTFHLFDFLPLRTMILFVTRHVLPNSYLFTSAIIYWFSLCVRRG